MGIAFTSETDVEHIAWNDAVTMPSSASAALALIRAYFLEAQWVESPTPINRTDPVNGAWTQVGYTYLLESPQGFQVLLELYRKTGAGAETNRLYFRMLSNDGSGTNAGREHMLFLPADSEPWTVWVNPCQFFLARDKHPKDNVNNVSMAGGVPYIDPFQISYIAGNQCSANPPPLLGYIDEAWWISDGSTPFNVRTLARPWQGWSACVNGAIRTSRDLTSGNHDAKSWQPLGLFTLNYANLAPTDFTWYADAHRGQYIEPFIGWSLSHTDFTQHPKVIGQLWDSFIETKQRPLNDPKTTMEPTAGVDDVEREWFNFTYPFGAYTFYDQAFTSYALYLLKPLPDVVGGVARNYLF